MAVGSWNLQVVADIRCSQAAAADKECSELRSYQELKVMPKQHLAYIKIM